MAYETIYAVYDGEGNYHAHGQRTLNCHSFYKNKKAAEKKCAELNISLKRKPWRVAEELVIEIK